MAENIITGLNTLTFGNNSEPDSTNVVRFGAKAEDVTVTMSLKANGITSVVTTPLSKALFARYKNGQPIADDNNGLYEVNLGETSVWQSMLDYQDLTKKRLFGYSTTGKSFLSSDPAGTVQANEINSSKINFSKVFTYDDTIIDMTSGSAWQKILEDRSKWRDRLIGIYSSSGQRTGYFESDNETALKDALSLTDNNEVNTILNALKVDGNTKSLYQQVAEDLHLWNALQAEYYKANSGNNSKIAHTDQIKEIINELCQEVETTTINLANGGSATMTYFNGATWGQWCQEPFPRLKFAAEGSDDVIITLSIAEGNKVIGTKEGSSEKYILKRALAAETGGAPSEEDVKKESEILSTAYYTLRTGGST